MTGRSAARVARLAALPVALLATLAVVTPVAALTAVRDTWPVQSLADRGTNVAAIQGFLRGHGSTIAITGSYGTATRDAVRAFQTAHGLNVDGVVRNTTWRALEVSISLGSHGEAVSVLQRVLRAKLHADVPVDGVFGGSTRDAVMAFQRTVELTPTGSMGNTAWRRLIAHFEYPTWSPGLCDYGVGNGRANWGTSSTIAWLEKAATSFVQLGHGRVPVGDISFKYGGDIPLHQSHEQGLDVDLRPIRDHEDQCTWGTNWQYASYDRTATRQLIRAIRAAATGHVKLIYFNDPVLVGEGLTTRYPGHDDHLHIRFCEVWHPLAIYRC
jgi:peptidoglycan hydrolase-like protein with peptidoglycan-binding domain